MIFFIVLIFFVSIQFSPVQSFLGHKFADYLSKKLNTKVEIGRIDFQLIKTFSLSDVYIEDLHHDTLIYAKHLKLDLGKFNLKKRKIIVKSIDAENTRIEYKKYASDKDFNIQFLIDAFDTGDTTKSAPVYWDISCEEINLLKSEFAFKNEHDTLITKGFNHFDMDIKNINGRFLKILIDKDTISGKIEYLGARDKCGFKIQDLQGNFIVNPIQTKFEKLRVLTDNSKILTDISFKYKSLEDIQDFIHKVKIESNFSKSILSIDDVAYFAQELNDIKEKIVLSGKITGKIDDIRGNNIEINVFGSTKFKGDVALTGLPNIEETLIHLNIDNLSTSAKDIEKIPIPPFIENKHLEVGNNIERLGNIKFKGTFTGLYNDFYAYGKFKTDIGNLSSDLSFRQNFETKTKSYKGKINALSFNFGNFFGVEDLGVVTAQLDVDGSGLTLDEVSATLVGNVSELIYKEYSYKNLKVEGDIARKIFKGILVVKDDNVDFDFNGSVDFTGKKPNLDFISTINKIDLGAINVIKTTHKTILSSQVLINVTGSNIDNLVGRINIDNTIYTVDNKKYKLSVLDIFAKEDLADTKTIRLYSDFADAEINGKFKILELATSVQYLLHKYIPNYFPAYKPTNSKMPFQDFVYKCVFKKTEPVTKLFFPDVLISKQSQFSGLFNSTKNEFTFKGISDEFQFKNYVLKKMTLDAVATSNNLLLNSTSKMLMLSDSIWVKSFSVTTNTNNDSSHVNLSWDNKTIKTNKGDFNAYIYFNSPSKITSKILSSEFVVSDSNWVVSESNLITIDTTFIKVDNLKIKSNNQSIALLGNISNDKSDKLKLKLQNFNMSNLNLFTKSHNLEFDGIADGETEISDIYHNLVFLSDTKLQRLYINKNEIGNGEIQSVWDKSIEGISLNGKFTLGIVPNILFSGFYYPKRENESLNFKINLEALQMQIFEPFVKDYCSSFKGFFAGNMTLKGTLSKPLMEGEINVNAKKLTVDYLNTTYKFSHSIAIENNAFVIQNLELKDINNNKSVVNGKVEHDNFKNFKLNIDLNSSKFMCLNTTENENQTFYGKCFITGLTNISGYVDNILIKADVKTEKLGSSEKFDIKNIKSTTELTKLFIPLSSTSEVNESDFIKFVNKNIIEQNKDEIYKVKLGGLTLDLAVEVTPDAELQLIFDQKVGDIIKASGNGNIKLKIDALGDFKMYGDYIIEQGDYLFTLQNVLNKHFDIEKGSAIKWTGIPYEADLNINAIYKPRASLSPFFLSDEVGVDRKRHPIDLKLLMTQNLIEPLINFQISLPPSIDSKMQQEVMGYLSNEAELNRQVFSLLILNSFVTPYQLSSGGGGGSNALYAAEANSTELLSNQLSNMLSQISNEFDIGVNYRPGDEISKDELEVALSTQLFNDKLTIDGNVGTNGNSQNQHSNNLVGDVSIDYKITEDGKLRVKAFNKANDNNQLSTSGGYTQGVGVFYKEEFETIGELFKKYLSYVSTNEDKKKKKEN